MVELHNAALDEIDNLHARWRSEFSQVVQDSGWFFQRGRDDADATLTLLIIDDAIPGARKLGKYEDAAFVLRAAFCGVEHPDVARVIVTDHTDLNYTAALKGLTSETRNERICVLLDVFGPGEKADQANPLGAQVAEELIGRHIPARNCRLFSKSGNQELVDRFELGESIPKITQYRDDAALRILKRDIIAWLDECMAYHASPFRKNSGADPLERIASQCEKFHAQFQAHNIRDCLANRVEPSSIGVAATDCEKLAAAYHTANGISLTVTQALLAPLLGVDAQDNAFAAFALSKALSWRKAKSRNLIPGYWLRLLLGEAAPSELAGWALAVNEHCSVGGCLAALGMLSTEGLATTALAPHMPQLELSFAFAADGNGHAGLENLEYKIQQRAARPLYGRTQHSKVDAFTALFAAGFELSSLSLTRDRLTVHLGSSTNMLLQLP